MGEARLMERLFRSVGWLSTHMVMPLAAAGVAAMAAAGELKDYTRWLLGRGDSELVIGALAGLLTVTAIWTAQRRLQLLDGAAPPDPASADGNRPAWSWDAVQVRLLSLLWWLCGLIVAYLGLVALFGVLWAPSEGQRSGESYEDMLRRLAPRGVDDYRSIAIGAVAFVATAGCYLKLGQRRDLLLPAGIVLAWLFLLACFTALIAGFLSGGMSAPA